jgi:hypothetical protein
MREKAERLEVCASVVGLKIGTLGYRRLEVCSRAWRMVSAMVVSLERAAWDGVLYWSAVTIGVGVWIRKAC